ncbi:MAG: SpoIIE family protein phosphatase [Leptospirales bacterium]|jgi:hypothetical protein
MVPKLKKSYFTSNPDRGVFIYFADFFDYLRKFMFRPAPVSLADRRLLQELLVSIERLVVATFGASTFILLLLETVLGHAPASSGPFDSACTALCCIAGLTAVFAFVRFPGQWFHAYYSVFYITAFLILSHLAGTGDPDDQFLLYIAFSLAQALRAGRLPGLPVLAFLCTHWSLCVAFGAQAPVAGADPMFRGAFTFAWAVLFALFLESMLFFAVNRYLELLARRRQEDADLELASLVHESLFPGFVENDYLRLHVYRSPENHTGGDFYDLLKMREGSLGFFFADVAGHGISSAMMSVAMKVILANLPYRLRLRPADLLDHLDEVVSREYESHHASGVYMCFDLPNRSIRLSNAGHPPVLYSEAGGPFRELKSEGSVIGYRIQTPIATECSVPMRSGDRFLLYTDGLTEYTPRNGAPINLSLSIEEILAETPNSETDQLLDRLLHQVRSRPDFERFRDDVMLALIEIK